MSTQPTIEKCPRCGDVSRLRPKLVLIDEAWVYAPGKDPRLRYFADLRVDAVRSENLREKPLEQFVDGYFCDACGLAFVPDESMEWTRRRS